MSAGQPSQPLPTVAVPAAAPGYPPAQLVPVAIAPPRRGGSRALTVLLLLLLLGSVALNLILLAGRGGSSDADNRIDEKHISHKRYAPNKVAIISVEGTILSGEGFFKRQIDHARHEAKEGRLKAIVLRVNSPGGTISGSDYMYHHLAKLREEFKLPIVVSMGAIAASGGYYVSMAVGDQPDSIYAEPSTWTGSIGVIIPHYDLSKLVEGQWKIKEDSIKSHELKGMGSMLREMTDEERKILKGLVDEGFTQFKDVVLKGRPGMKKEQLEEIATGQVFTAEQAKKNHLIDQIGFQEDAVERAIKLARLAPDEVMVVKYKAQTGLSDLFFGGEGRVGYDLKTLLDLATPQAYYYYGQVPALLTSRER